MTIEVTLSAVTDTVVDVDGLMNKSFDFHVSRMQCFMPHMTFLFNEELNEHLKTIDGAIQNIQKDPFFYSSTEEINRILYSINKLRLVVSTISPHLNATLVNSLYFIFNHLVSVLLESKCK